MGEAEDRRGFTKTNVQSVKAWVYLRKKRNLKALKSLGGQLAFKKIRLCHGNNIQLFYLKQIKQDF